MVGEIRTRGGEVLISDGSPGGGNSGDPDLGHRWTVAQIGAREHYSVAAGFHRLGLLSRLYTDAWARHPDLLGALPSAAARGLAARNRADLPPRYVRAFTTGAVLWDLTSRLRSRRGGRYARYIRQGEWFAKRVGKELARGPLAPRRDAFFGYSTGSLEALLLLRGQGVLTIVDQIDPGRVEEDLVQEERRRWPGWEPDAEPVPEAYYERLAAEWDAADLVMVNSQWSRDALARQGVPIEKLIEVPLAYETPVGGHIDRSVRPSSGGTLRVLWLGTVNLRKGVQYLLAAAGRLLGENVAFTIAGPVEISERAIASAPRNVEFVGRVDRSELSATYAQADVFVLPTISDGFAITQLEAMAHGLPVVATTACGRVVSDGLDGLLVAPRDVEALADAIAGLSQDRGRVAAMSAAAHAKASTFTLDGVAGEIEGHARRVRTLNVSPRAGDPAAEHREEAGSA